MGGEGDLSQAVNQETAEDCQSVHRRFRMHAVIILNAAMIAPLADKLSEISSVDIHCPIHPTIAIPQHHDDSYAIFFTSVWLVCG